MPAEQAAGGPKAGEAPGLKTLDELRAPIEAALVYTSGTHDFDDVRRGVESGHFQFWPGETSAVITEVVQYPRFKALQVFLAGGQLNEIEAMAPGIEEFGRQQGCTRIGFLGRAGWQRSFLTRRGYTPKLVLLERAL